MGARIAGAVVAARTCGHGYGFLCGVPAVHPCACQFGNIRQQRRYVFGVTATGKVFPALNVSKHLRVAKLHEATFIVEHSGGLSTRHAGIQAAKEHNEGLRRRSYLYSVCHGYFLCIKDCFEVLTGPEDR